MASIGQGGTITLDAVYQDATGTAVTPTTPLVTIYNPSSVAVVTNATPTATSVGHYGYDYAVSPTAPLGNWSVHWTGTINGVAVSSDETFIVLAAGVIVAATPGSGTVADLVADTRRELYGMHRAEYNRLTGTTLSTDTTLAFDFDLKGLVAGTIVSIEDELVYVWSATPATKQAVVARGWGSTTAAAHAAAVVCEVSPRFPQDPIRDALQAEIRSWGQNLYQTASIEIGTSSTTDAYDLPIGSFYQVLDVRRSDAFSATWRRVNYEVDRNADTTSFPSGNSINIREKLPTNVTLRVVYSKALTADTFTDATNLVSDVGMQTSWFDIARYGAAWRLLAPREIKRTFTEGKGEERTSAEVPPNFTMQTAVNMKRLRDQRMEDEMSELRKTNPWRF